MKWTSNYDSIFLCEMFLFEPWNYKNGSKERGQCWERISESLNQLTEISFKVTQRSVQDHYQTLEKVYKKQKREEDGASGINPEETEVNVALSDITERFEETQKVQQEACEKQEKSRTGGSKSRRHAKKVVRNENRLKVMKNLCQNAEILALKH